MVFDKNYLLGPTFLYLVLSAKKLFVYNEEGLVLLCFVCFLTYSFVSFGSSINDFFAERQQTIQTELENFLELKEQFLAEFEEVLRSTSHNKAMLLSLEPICTDSMGKLVASREQGLTKLCSGQIQQKLRALNYSQKLLEERLQISIALGFRESVLEAFQFSKQKLKLNLIREGLQVFKKDHLKVT
jgi:hypothetical protein